jgi:polyisoprenoid-binding protein YceI
MLLKNLLLNKHAFIMMATVLLSSNLFAKETYTIKDPKRLEFTYFVAGVPMRGDFHIENSSFTIDFNNEEQSSFFIKIDIRKSTAGFPFATKAMLGSSVLNAEKYPFMHFKSTNILKKENQYEIKGLLKLRGIKKKLVIIVESEKNYQKSQNNLNFKIKSSIDRNKFGANGYSLLVQKEIKLNSNIELIREK